MTNNEKKLLLISLLLLIVIFLSGCSKDNDTYITENIYYSPDQENPDDVPEEEPEECDRDLTSDNPCNTKLVGFQNGLDDNDKGALETAKQRCKVYYPEAPCLKQFIKKGNQTYHAICGKLKE